MSAEKNPKSRSKCGPIGSAEVFRTPLYSLRDKHGKYYRTERTNSAGLSHHRFDTDHVLCRAGLRPGTVSQVRVCGNELMRIGKGSDLPVLIVAHVTKSGDLAGPKIVEHLVDTVLLFYRRTESRSPDSAFAEKPLRHDK